MSAESKDEPIFAVFKVDIETSSNVEQRHAVIQQRLVGKRGGDASASSPTVAARCLGKLSRVRWGIRLRSRAEIETIP